MGIARLAGCAALGLVWVLSASAHTRAQSTALTFRGVAEESGEVGPQTMTALREVAGPLSACADGATDLVARLRYRRASPSPRVEWVEGPRRARACAERAMRRRLRRVEAERGPSSVFVVWWSSRAPSAPPVVLRSSSRRGHGPGEGSSTTSRSISLRVQGAGSWEAPHAAWLQTHGAAWSSCVTRHDEGRTVRVTFDGDGTAAAASAFSTSASAGQALGACLQQHLRTLAPDAALARQVWFFTIDGLEGVSELVQP